MTTRKTHDTKVTLGGSLDPEELYNPGHAPGTDSRSETVTFNEVEDLSNSAHESAADYTSRLSKGDAAHQVTRRLNKSNTYQLPPDIQSSPEGQNPMSPMFRSGIDSEAAANDIRNTGQTLGTYMNTAQGFNEDQARYFEDLSNSSYGKWGAGAENPFVDGPGGHVIDKEKGKGSHQLLEIESVDPTSTELGRPTVYSDPGPTEMQRRISSVMLVNRFNSSDSTPFMEDGQKTAGYGYTKQSKKGSYDPNAPAVQSSDLKKIGEDLISRAVGHDIDPDSTGIGGKYDMALLPSVEQLTGWNTINMGKLRAMNTKGGQNVVPDDAGVRSSLMNGNNGAGNVDKKKTYGQLNSEYEHFDGPLPLGMVVNTVIGLAALLVTTAVIMGIAEGIGAATGQANNGHVPANTPPLDLAFGRHALSANIAGDFLSRIFNIYIPEQNFGTSMFSGVLMFYGIPAIPGPGAAAPGMPGTDWTDIMDAIGGIAMAPGYYAVVTRNVARDTQQIEEAISDMGTDLGLGGMITQVLKIIEALTNSATWKFLMTMVKIGEKGLHGEHGHPTLSERINARGEGPTTRHMKSREMTEPHWSSVGSTEQGRLSWRHSSAPKRYLFPASFKQAVVRMTGAGIVDDHDLLTYEVEAPTVRMYYEENGGSPTIPAQDTGDGMDAGGDFNGVTYDGTTASVKGRLPIEYVNWVEDQLDSEYMPFYFHDLRTNEIISFHAFMTDLTDGFSADYSSMSAYGRADDVMIYNKTTRSISFGFMVAATSEEDMTQMYWDINKLISMIYPQYSRGRTMIQGIDPDPNAPGDLFTKFVQPFSQIPTASPMIRVRFGDMLKSTYSKFGLMRLFGLGEPGDAFTLDQGEVDPAALAGYAAELQDRTNQANKIKAMKEIDPGGSDTQQQAGLSAAGIGFGGGENDVDPSDNTQFGYAEGDLVMLKSAPTKYWVRNDEGKLARQIDNYSGPAGARDLHKYHADVQVKIVKRVPDGAAANSSQSPNNFADHVPGASPPAAEGDGQDEQGRSTYHRRMAYMVEVVEGSPAHVSIASKVDANMKYHRALHSEIAGISPAGMQVILDGLPAVNVPERASAEGALKRFFAGNTADGAEPGKENYLVRSFESAMGRGLAGFITDLSFDWAESTWETKPGMRAPQMMKVSVSFAPIHDIPMGLDHDGMMRSVAYNVGNASRMIGHDAVGSTSALQAFNQAELAGLTDQSAAAAAGSPTGDAADEAAGTGLPPML